MCTCQDPLLDSLNIKVRFDDVRLTDQLLHMQGFTVCRKMF